MKRNDEKTIMHDSTRSWSSRSSRATLLALAGLHLLAACATAQKPLPDVVWPPPPETPRIKWVRSFQTEEHLGQGTLRVIGRAFLPTEGEAGIEQPTGIALSPDEKILYVACNAKQRILAVDLEKRTMVRIATNDDRPGGPFGVATDAEGSLYVTDHVKNTVYVYGPDRKFLRKFGEAKLERPTGIAVDRRRQVVYVTSGAIGSGKHHRVEVFSLKGQHLRTIGTRGTEPGTFNFPANLGVARDGQLYVVDMLNFRVQVFDPDGQLVQVFGKPGAGEPGTFDKAKAVAFDSFGNVYVVDSQQGYVQIFNSKYQPLMAFGGRLDLPGYMRVPGAIAISSRNAIYVADFAAGAVHEYQLINTAAADSYAPTGEPKPGVKPAGDAGPAVTREKPQGG